MSQSVSPVTESRRPMTPTISPAWADSSCSSFLLAWIRQSLSDVFLFVFARVEHATVAFERAGVNPHPGEVARLVGQNLEDQPTERLLGVGLANDFGSVIGCMAGPLAFPTAAGRVSSPCRSGRCPPPAVFPADWASTRRPHPEAAARRRRARPSRTAPAEFADAPSPHGAPCVSIARVSAPRPSASSISSSLKFDSSPTNASRHSEASIGQFLRESPRSLSSRPSLPFGKREHRFVDQDR